MDKLLDIESRLGISEGELEAFESRAEEVSRLIAGLKSGTIRPEDVPGVPPLSSSTLFLSEEERREREEKEREERAEKERLEKERQAREKQEQDQKERQDWWEKAELLRGQSRTDARAERISRIVQILQQNDQHKAIPREPASRVIKGGEREQSEVKEIRDDDGNLLFPKPKKKVDALDYSVWDKWVPDDPVSLSEMQRAKDEIEAQRNAAFEQANPEFCNQFREDQAARERKRADKEREADKLRAKGNQFFVRGAYDKALANYKQAIGILPWSIPALCNAAQAFMKLNCVEEALEFSERALFLDEENVKGLWRHAKACVANGNLQEAVYDLTLANLLEPNNNDVKKELDQIRQDLLETNAENYVQQQLATANNNNDKDAKSLTESLLEALDDKNEKMGIKQRMCETIAAINSATLEPNELERLAIDGFLTLLQDTNETEEKAKLCAMLRKSGAFGKLCDVVAAETCDRSTQNEKPTELVVQSILHSKRNQSIFLEKGMLKRFLSSSTERSSAFDALVLLSQHCLFREEMATSSDALTAMEKNLQHLDSVPRRFQQAALLLCNLCATDNSRSALVQAVGSNVLKLLLRGLQSRDKNVREDTAAALANLCRSREGRELAQNASELLVRSAILASAEHNTPAGVAFMLAALINLSVEADSPCRKILAQAKVLDNLLAMTLDSQRPTVVCERAAALLSRVLADSSLVQQTQRFSSRQGVDAVDKLCVKLVTMEPLSDQASHYIRCVASLLRQYTGMPTVHVVEDLTSILGSHASLAEGGCRQVIRGDEQSTANVVQCFVSMCGHPEACQSPVWRDRVIPSLIKLLQFCQDGPIRKNAAISIAKLARSSPENMGAIRRLRGMEMLVELGNRLV